MVTRKKLPYSHSKPPKLLSFPFGDTSYKYIYLNNLLIFMLEYGVLFGFGTLFAKFNKEI